MSTLARLVHLRWNVPVIAELHRGRGGRFVNLVHGLGVSRESLRRTIAFLEADGLIHRNPGHGHPLRPEYLLTDAGELLGEPAAALTDVLHELDAADVGLRKWSLPILIALGDQPRRFSELGNSLPGTTNRALALALKDLESAGLVTRTVTTDYPPATLYGVTPTAAPLARAADRLNVRAE
ncbi:HxlR family transcriptional regulator [Kribbella steppae]|uniref:HxlR family transcriptional regulator n=1 Tax=Kribbella steppae TaxID=2512223 RepID=A0A4R2HF06_9ACTN|nr:winged helix-turn-helix transcriptional regulator [Kribbella steppae]TCO26534.1 HxlR family transcriptional regulator [Kribbella steppae]